MRNGDKKLLKEIKPYLMLKKQQAELGLEFYDKCGIENKYGRAGIPAWLNRRREEYRKKMKELNRKGKMSISSSSQIRNSVVERGVGGVEYPPYHLATHHANF